MFWRLFIKVVLFIFSTLEEAGGLSRVYRALSGAKELHESGVEVAVVFDGSGTEALAAMSEPSHRLHQLLEDIHPQVAGACRYCAQSHSVKPQIEAAKFPLLGDYHGHASLAMYVMDGYQVITY